jgi:hypothetical protein
MRTLLLATALLCAMAPAQAEPQVQPIRFARGSSGAEVAGAVVRGERALFSLEARAGQTLTARITAPEGNAVFQVWHPGAVPRQQDGMATVEGTALPGAGEGDDARSWSGTLPASGAYLIVVGGTRGNATFRLSVTVR